jgi:hypothetical protein
MSYLDKINSLTMPFSALMGVAFIEAKLERVVATMRVREDLCTVGHSIHGGAVMALADAVGAAAKPILRAGPQPARRSAPSRRPCTSGGARRCGRRGSRRRTANWSAW